MPRRRLRNVGDVVYRGADGDRSFVVRPGAEVIVSEEKARQLESDYPDSWIDVDAEDPLGLSTPSDAEVVIGVTVDDLKAMPLNRLRSFVATHDVDTRGRRSKADLLDICVNWLQTRAVGA